MVIDQTALHIALRAAGHTPDEIATMTDGWVWLGDLSGMEVVPVLREGPAGTPLQLRVTHRCGHEGVLIRGMGMDGMSADGSAMLGNLTEFAAKWREGHACPPHQRSPETDTMVQRWLDTASGAPKPVTTAQGDPFGILQHVELVDVSDEEDEGEPIVKPLTGYDLYTMTRYGAGPVDGPGCVPMVPPLPYSPPRPEDSGGWVTNDEGSRVWGPDVVPQQDTGEPVARGSLYSDKCAECTTGVSCEDAGHCLFEG